ncbi:hypothetical protein BUALT_Bualt02G0086500 [Buddleja alternifolia]|uniref:30S ribosomal protein S21, chloroplastic n=1 Tax=Buddleja alternifolia TaxID=168488 RepID=A0AAV6Y5B9_9LAMI|nr:hypothetical protein BUALT_Bualt02G0086500 [Buddleja alternifolia]
MALSNKLNPLSFFPPQTTSLPAQKSPPSQLSLTPFRIRNPHLSSIQLNNTQLLIPETLPNLPLKTKTKEEEQQQQHPNHHHHCNKSDDSLSVAFPSLAFSNTLFFSSSSSSVYNVQVIVGVDEPEENLISRFRREVLRPGVVQESKRRRFFECPREKRKRKAREAAKRNRKRRPQPKVYRQVQAEDSKKKKEDSDDDNWEFLDIDPPYC